MAPGGGGGGWVNNAWGKKDVGREIHVSGRVSPRDLPFIPFHYRYVTLLL